MRQFLLVGPEGSFAVPLGESRVGSDAACQICIRGEGILPVHAYLSTDGETLLIRPAASGGSSTNGSAVGSITVNGEPLSGPVTLSSNAELAVGTVAMRLLAQRPPLASRLWARRWCRTVVWAAAAAGLLLAVAYAVLRWVILDENRLKQKLANSIQEHLLRDDSYIGGIQVYPFEGLVRIKDVRIKDRDTFGGQEPFIEIPGATISLDVWPWLRSWGREYRHLRVAVANPTVNLRRSKTDGSLNIQDLVGKYGQGLELALQELDASLEISGGTVRLNDLYTNTGQTSLEQMTVRLRQPGLRRPLEIEACEMLVNAIPAPAAPGHVKLAGKLSLFDTASSARWAGVTGGNLRLEMDNFDLARIFEHLGYAWEPYGVGFKVVLGKPVNGKVSVNIPDARHVQLKGDDIESASLVSIREEGRPPLGNIPMGLSFDVLLADGGSGFLPHEMSVGLRSGADLHNPATLYLVFRADGRLNPGGTSEYSVNLDCSLQDLLGTDVGRRLDLDGRLGGRLRGNARLVGEANGAWEIDARMDSTDAYAMVSHPTDPAQPAVRQPLPLHFESHASAQPSPGARLPDVVVDSFRISAPSFEAHSEVPGLIKGLDRKTELTAQAKFRLSLKGREFWRDFKPILALFGFVQPVEELLDLEVTLVGRNDFLELAANGSAARQWEADPKPVRLQTYLAFDRKAAAAKAASPPPPYLQLMLKAESEGAKPLKVWVGALCRRDGKADTLALERYADNDKERATPLPGLVIESDIVALRERFKPYLEGYLQSREQQRKGEDSFWLRFYRDSTLTGKIEISQPGRVVFQRMLDPKSPQPDRVDFDLNIACTNLDAKLPLEPAAGGAPDAKQGAAPWTWREQAVTIALKGAYTERLSGNKEEPDVRRLDLEQFAVKGSVGAFQLKLRELDLFKLWHLRDLPKDTWTDCLASLAVSGRLDPPASAFARSLSLLPADSPFCGALALQIAFDRQKDTLDLRRFEFHQAEPKEKSFLNLDVAGALAGVRELSARLLPAAATTPLSARVATFVQEAGPAGLLDHLGEELTINGLQVETGPFVSWLSKDYQDGGREPPALLAGLLRNEWQPEGTWEAAGVKLVRQGDPKVRTWKLVGARLRNDLSWFGAPPKPGAERPVAFAMSHDWALQMGLSVDQNNNVMLAGDVVLDNAFIAASLPALVYDYKKTAGDKCQLELADCGYSQPKGGRLLLHIGKAKLAGKPVTVEVKDLDADYTRGPAGVIQLAEAIIVGGPLPCVVSALRYDPAGDLLKARFSAPEADATYLGKLLALPEWLSANGSLRGIDGAYKGSWVALQATVADLREMLGAEVPPVKERFPKLEPDDPRLSGLNPGTDTLDLAAEARDLQLVWRDRESSRSELRVDGPARLTTRDFACKDLRLALEVSHKTPRPKQTQVCACRPLQCNSADARLNLLRALKAPGAPLALNVELDFRTPLNPAPWLDAYDSFLAARSAPRAAPAAGAPLEKRFTALEQLAASGKLKAPAVLLGGVAFTTVDAPQLVLKGLKCAAPGLSADAYGGRITFTDADVDLSKTLVLRSGDKVDLKGLAFKLRLKLTDAELPRLLGASSAPQAQAPAPNPQGYTFSGRLDAQGNLEGMDFTGLDRLTWDGAIKVKLSGFACQAARAAEAATALSPWAAAFARLGPQYGAAFTAAASRATVNTADLGKELPAADALKPANGLALALQAYLARAFGTEVERLEFDPGAPTIMITKGFATLDRCQLVGRGSCEGVDLELSNLKVNLADEDLADEARLNLAALPQSARAALNLDRWPAAARDGYLRDLRDGKLALRVHGRLPAPAVKFPWLALRTFGRRALFGADSVSDLAGLEQARQHLLQAWGRLPEDLAAAAATGDRMGVGLPGTVTARNENETLIDRVANLPQSLVRVLEPTAPVLSPVDSLSKLLFPEPDVPSGKPGAAPAPGGAGHGNKVQPRNGQR